MAELPSEILTARGTSTLSAGRQKLLTDTYRLLSMTLLFSAAMSALAIFINFPFIGLWMLAPYFVLLFIVQAKQHKPSGILWTFAFTGWLGFSMGPVIGYYLQSSGPALVLNALSATGLTFLAASVAGRTMPQLMSRLFPIVALAILVAFVVSLLNILVFQSNASSIWISGVFAVLASLIIAGMTARIVRGEETSYIAATVTLFVMMWNIFMFFLQFFSNRN